MEWLIPLVLVLLVVTGFVIFLVMNATKKSGPAAEGEQGPPGIGQDPTPLGDTSEHAGRQSRDGTTARDPESRADRPADPDAAAHVARPGEGEGAQRIEFDGSRPAGASPQPEAARARSERAEDEPTRAAADSAPAEQAPGEGGGEEPPAQPASERLADRGA